MKKGELVELWNRETEDARQRTIREFDMLRYGWKHTKEFRSICGKIALSRFRMKRDAS